MGNWEEHFLVVVIKLLANAVTALTEKPNFSIRTGPGALAPHLGTAIERWAKSLQPSAP